ncbi:helix-turn-helix domain-containing protein [Microbacterium sp. NPDC089189]|uniref:MarR family winged helix-turn-helix transcriptional regulator n=1 Tax=Microbacterium sp. NPDC089189 TaxID=3154972 RepID=UPI00343F528C
MPSISEPSDAVTARARALGLSTERLAVTIDRDSYTPALLGLLNNVLVWGGSRVFHHLHGVGTNEWRIISALGNHPGATARELCAILGINKSIASKSVNVLLTRELIAQLDGPRGSRHLYLTASGIEVHDDFMPVAMRRQEILHETLTPAEITQLNALLVKMVDASESMQEYESEILRDPADQTAASTDSGANGTPGA